MLNKPVGGLICSLAVPTTISMLVTALYNMADTYFVGRIGTSATGAVGVIFSFMAVIQAVGFFFGHGSGNYISRKLGEQAEGETEKMAATGLITAFGAGVLMTVVGVCFLSPLARLLGSTETILPFARQYLFYILLGAPFIMSSFVLNNILRFQGSAYFAMIGMSAGGLLNIALDPIFINVFNMGVGGAGFATFLSQCVSFGILLFGCGHGGNIRISFRNFSFKPGMYLEIARGGLPSLARQGLASVAVILLNRATRGYGDAAIAAMSVVARVATIAVSAIIGFGQGFQPVCGFNYGAGRYDRVRDAFKFSVKVATGLLTFAAIGIFIFAPQIIEIFRDDPDVVRIGTLAMRVQSVALPLSGFIIISNMYLQTIGKAFPATLVAMSRQFLFFVPALLILKPTLGLFGIQITQGVSDMCAFILSVPVCLTVLNKMGKKAEKPHNERI